MDPYIYIHRSKKMLQNVQKAQKRPVFMQVFFFKKKTLTYVNFFLQKQGLTKDPNIKNKKDTRCELMKDVNKFMEENRFGNISCPTGAGKSAIVYLDIANRIMNGGDEKQIFLVSTPILRLNEQFTNDMFETLYEAGLINSDNAICGQLSSDYKAQIGTIEINGVDTEIRKCDAATALTDKKAKYIFIIACHKSVEQMFKKYNTAKYIKKTTPISMYYDESHTLSIKEN